MEGGSFFVAALNLVVPGVQIALTFLLFEPVRAAAIPALGKSFNRALYNGNAIAAKALWHEAESCYTGVKRDAAKPLNLSFDSRYCKVGLECCLRIFKA